MDAKNVRNMYSIIAVTNKHTAKLHHVDSLYIRVLQGIHSETHKTLDLNSASASTLLNILWLVEAFCSFIWNMQHSLDKLRHVSL